MLRIVQRFLGLSPLLLGVWGCSVASAAEPSQSRDTLSASSDVPPSVRVDAPPEGGRKPPQAAFDACKSHAEGDACSVTFDGRTMNGTCRKGPNGESDLACAPAHPPGPPPEAVEACKGKAEGATCSVTFGDRTMTSTCRKVPGQSDVIACAPPHPPGQPPSGSNQSLSGTALERKLDQLERDIQGS